MAKRRVLHVVHDKSDDSWKIRKEGSERASSSHDTKADASQTAFERGRNTPNSQVKVHGMNGKIQEERTYGNDPRKYPG